MIIDRIDNAHLYHAVNIKFKRAFDYIHEIDTVNVPTGRYEIDGSNMYALIQQYDTKLKEQGFWEAHRRYIDLQYIVQGTEGVGYANIHHLQQGEYDEVKDFLPLYGDGDLVTLRSGCFVLLLPEDAHMPGLAISSPAPVKKVVVKIAVD
jgi:YhcH/YjgK/YiaL family protein